MARPTLKPHKRRSEYLRLRLTPVEMDDLRRKAMTAGVSMTEYARATILGRRPKAMPKKDLIVQQINYELTSIATNFRQLEAALDDPVYGDWAKYVGGELLDRLLDRPDLLPLMEDSIEIVNSAGQIVNALARRANVGKEIDDAERDSTLEAVRRATEGLYQAVSKAPGDAKGQSSVEPPHLTDEDPEE